MKIVLPLFMPRLYLTIIESRRCTLVSLPVLEFRFEFACQRTLWQLSHICLHQACHFVRLNLGEIAILKIDIRAFLDELWCPFSHARGTDQSQTPS